MAGWMRRLGLSRVEADERYRAALEAFRGRQREEAIAAMRGAIEALPRRAEYHAALGFLLLEDKRADLASQAFERALELDGYDMLANYGSGMMAYRAKRWSAAEASFLKALAAKPGRAETLYYLAMARHRLGANVEALHWMNEAEAAFVKAKDNRDRFCAEWRREFEKLIALEEDPRARALGREDN